MIAIMPDDFASLVAPLSPKPARFAQGEAVFRTGDPVTTVHIVRSGTIHLVRHHRDGARIVMQRAGPGDVLAEASTFSDRYHCDAIAMSAAETMAVGRAILLARMGTDPDFARRWAARLAREVQQARLKAEILSMRTVAERLDAWLAWHDAMPPRGAWAGIAGEIGVSPEALYREMARRRR